MKNRKKHYQNHPKIIIKHFTIKNIPAPNHIVIMSRATLFVSNVIKSNSQPYHDSFVDEWAHNVIKN